ncbi:hypothetical protein DFH08DRAFT_715267, partial [Mycena albidolilacea]
DPEPQIIAQAITAFQHTNLTRNRQLHLPIFDEIMFPAITMRGTSPIFYMIEVTASLDTAVTVGVFPEVLTIFTATSPASRGSTATG